VCWSGHRDPFLFSLVNVAPGALPERLDETLLVAIEIQDVFEMLLAMRGAVKQLAAALDLDVLPAGALPVLGEAVHQRLKNVWGFSDRVANVRERQRHPALTGEEAVDFHDRDQAGKLAVLYDGEVERLVVVGLSQHPRPGRGVEKRGPVGGQEQIVPVGGFYRVYDLNIQLL